MPLVRRIKDNPQQQIEILTLDLADLLIHLHHSLACIFIEDFDH